MHFVSVTEVDGTEVLINPDNIASLRSPSQNESSDYELSSENSYTFIIMAGGERYLVEGAPTETYKLIRDGAVWGERDHTCRMGE